MCVVLITKMWFKLYAKAESVQESSSPPLALTRFLFHELLTNYAHPFKAQLSSVTPRKRPGQDQGVFYWSDKPHWPIHTGAKYVVLQRGGGIYCIYSTAYTVQYLKLTCCTSWRGASWPPLAGSPWGCCHSCIPSTAPSSSTDWPGAAPMWVKTSVLKWTPHLYFRWKHF